MRDFTLLFIWGRLPNTSGKKIIEIGFCCLWLTSQSYNNFKCPVMFANALAGAGPMASTVLDPAAICVLPASSTCTSEDNIE
jgi:hypothetical protein